MSVSSLLSPKIVCCYFYYFFIGLCFYILALHLHTPCGSIANLYLSDLLLSLSTFVKRIIFLTNLIFHPGCLPPCYIAFITRCFYLLEKVNTFSIHLFSIYFHKSYNKFIYFIFCTLFFKKVKILCTFITRNTNKCESVQPTQIHTSMTSASWHNQRKSTQKPFSIKDHYKNIKKAPPPMIPPVEMHLYG